MPTGSPVRMRLTKTQREKLATLGQRYIKSADPTVNDDSGEGYAVWDKWLNQTSGEAYVCTDATEGAAVWQNISLDVDDLSSLFDAKANKDTDAVVGNLTQFTTGGDIVDSGIPASQVDWMFKTHDNGSQSGAVTLTPANGAMQESAITGNITGLTCALSATYPYVIWELTTDGVYTIDLTGYETDGGNAITLPDTGKCIITLSLSADGTTKHALLAATDMA